MSQAQLPIDDAASAKTWSLGRVGVISALGIGQIFAWGSSYYLLAVLAKPIHDDTGWSLSWIVGGLSLGLLIAGLISPYVGRVIDRHGGRFVMSVSAPLLSAGLATLGLATDLAVYVAGWVILGFGMGAGLYDPAFSTLGKLYGRGARSAISALTLWGGFASTVCWPLSAYLVATVGWRDACLAYAALHLLVTLPTYFLALPGMKPSVVSSAASGEKEDKLATDESRVLDNPALVFALVAGTFTLSAALTTVLSVHLLTILQARDIALGAAVALGALVGPSQVGARVIEMIFGHRLHPY